MNDDDANAVEKAIVKAYEKLDNAWFRGLLQGVPGVGSVLDTWFFQFAEKAKAQRVEEALEVRSS